jgi:hypothetical protein
MKIQFLLLLKHTASHIIFEVFKAMSFEIVVLYIMIRVVLDTNVSEEYKASVFGAEVIGVRI